MFNKILIANRGEIACRVIKTAQRLGIKTVAVFSDADRNSQHVKHADEAIHIGGAASKDSYLVGSRIIQAALKTGAQAIHPGYGFLSENADFAQQCADNGLIFIGPPIDAIKSMGSKSAAKTIMEHAGVPLVPGYHGEDQNPAILKKSADDMGYPVLLKAVAGGGGKGMRQVWSADEFDSALKQAKSESMASFGDDHMLVEKYLTQPRHVELQVFCDQHGNSVYLFERDCSVQRRHQKVIEEAPAPGISANLRKEMGDAAVRAAQAINYVGAGTVEFLLDVYGSFYFMEMNTRLQVEHPVTEMITGQDLVEWQLRVANDEPLPLKQEQLQIHGHSFEARIYAEDPHNDFLPTAGHLSYLQTPPLSTTVRVDSGVIQGDEVSPFYDPMIAKLIVWGENREQALSRLAGALTEYRIAGVKTNISFLHKLATCTAFAEAELDTGFIEKHQSSLFSEAKTDLNATLSLIALFLTLEQQHKLAHADSSSIWNKLGAWRLNQANLYQHHIELQDQQYAVSVEQVHSHQQPHFEINIGDEVRHASAQLNGSELTAEIDGHRQQASLVAHNQSFTIFSEQGTSQFSLVMPDFGEQDEDTSGDFIAPMNGTVVEVLVSSGEQVAQGQELLVMEAMKMQHTIVAPSAGTVVELYCEAGELVDGGAELLAFQAE